MNKAPKKLNQNVKIMGVLAVLLIASLIALIVVISHKKGDGSITASNKSEPSDSSLSVGNAQTSTAADTLANLKNNPQYQNPQTGIPYDELFRNSDKYKGTYVHYTGEVIQVLGDSGNWNLRVSITKTGTEPYTLWQDPVFIYSYAQDRVIEKDIIEFTALVNGVTTYKATLGQEVTIPSLTIYEDTVIGRADY